MRQSWAVSNTNKNANRRESSIGLDSDVETLIEVFAIPPSNPAPNMAASWNVAPTDPLPFVRYNEDPRAQPRSWRLWAAKRSPRSGQPNTTS